MVDTHFQRRTARPRRPRWSDLAILLVVLLAVVCAIAVIRDVVATGSAPALSAAPPRASGYFGLEPAGSWSDLPGDRLCADRIHLSTWEPRPVNAKRNHVVPNPAAVHRSLSTRPRNTAGAYDPRWDTWLLPRVDGQFRGTTDEILQWAACKWGLPDNLLRAIAVRESSWYQYPTYASGRCVSHWGCGDIFEKPDTDTAQYCEGLAKYGYDYQRAFGPGICPKTFSIVGVMAWQAPSWGRMADNQNGTFPFSRDSTAFAADYLGAYLRGCLEGWEVWLQHTGDHSYRPGRLLGCVGSWYAGGWYDQAARGYIHNVRTEWRNHTWLKVAWPMVRPACSSENGCIGRDRLHTS